MRVRFVAELLLISLCLAAITTRGAATSEFKSGEQPVLTVTGRIFSTRHIAGACYLYFARDSKPSLAAVIYDTHRSQFPDRPEHYYHDRHVKVSGVVIENEGQIEIILKDPDQIAVIEPAKPITPVRRDQRSLRLEVRMTRLQAELRNLKQQLARSGRSSTADTTGSDIMGHKLQIELKHLQQQVQDLNKKVRDLEDMVVHLAERYGR